MRNYKAANFRNWLTLSLSTLLLHQPSLHHHLLPAFLNRPRAVADLGGQTHHGAQLLINTRRIQTTLSNAPTSTKSSRRRTLERN